MSRRGATPAAPRCPSCGNLIASQDLRCRSCRFTGSDTIAMFGPQAADLAGIIDKAELWSPEEIARIDAERRHLRRVFPQLRIHVETTLLPEGTSLPTYGFWRLNAAPLRSHETHDHRSWAVLLVIDATSGCAAAIPGYRAGHWIDDAQWTRALEAMRKPFARNQSARAVVAFIRATGQIAKSSWIKQNARR